MKRNPPTLSSSPNPSPVPLPRRAARIVQFEPGSHWRLGLLMAVEIRAFLAINAFC